MKFGIFYEHQLPRPWSERSEQQLISDALEQCELADRLGIQYVWEVEHHFLEEYSHSSAPEVFLAAVSQRGLLGVGGDFNDLPDSRVHRALCAALVDCWREAVGEEEGPTYPSSSPRKRIDWLLRARGSQWRTESARVVPTAASDHCAVVFELTRMR